jgi:hypothetical protein
MQYLGFGWGSSIMVSYLFFALREVG